MAFYKDVKGKTRREKQAVAQNRGGFDDEGSHYTGKYGFGKSNSRNGEGKRYHDGSRSEERRFDGGRKPYGDHRNSDRMPYGGDRHSDSGKRYDSARPGQERREGRPEGRKFSPKPQQGEYRFSKNAPRYEERGRNVTPASYDEQRKARRGGEESGYNKFRYAAPATYQPAPAAETEPDVVPNENLLSGRNPIREALKSGRDIEKLLVARGELSGSAREIVQMARERHIPVQEVDRARLDAITHNHQGMLAFASAYRYSTLEDMLELAEARQEQPFLILLDGITDPHNLGAIIRTAECAGAHGVIVQERRAVGLTPAAVKASAGAVEYIPVARVTNLGNTIEALKERNIWVYAADMDGEDYAGVKFDGAVALVVGAEGEGVSRRVLECCDKTVSLPLRGQLDSLNASVAAGVLMYAVIRSR